MSGMDRSESVVLDTLRKLCPERDWMYLGEVERWEISKMVGSLTETYRSSCDQLKAENDRLRALLQHVAICASGEYCYGCPHQNDGCDRDERLRAEGIEVPE